MRIDYCTRCKKKLSEMKIDIEFHINVTAEKENSIWEELPNLNNNSREVLCLECFNKFSDAMSQLNIEYKNE